MRTVSRTPGTRIVPFGKAHLKEGLETYNHYILHSNALFLGEPVSPKEFSSTVHLGAAPPASWAVLSGGRFAGYASLSTYSAYPLLRRTAWISIYLRPEWTGKGLGRAALDHLVAVARRRRLRTLIALIVEGNRPSVRLFTRGAFVRCGRVRDYGFKHGRYRALLSFQRILR